MIRFIVLSSWLLLALLLPLDDGFCCERFKSIVKEAANRYLGADFPWWYNLGLYKTESNCRWIVSLDGHGSVGYTQLTPKFVDIYLRSLFPDYDKPYSNQHHFAFAYFLSLIRKNIYCNKLWNLFQCYNRSCWKVNREAMYSGCRWYEAKYICENHFKENICVWKVATGCRQYRTNCDINYSYSYKVFSFGRFYREGKDSIPFF